MHNNTEMHKLFWTKLWASQLDAHLASHNNVLKHGN